MLKKYFIISLLFNLFLSIQAQTISTVAGNGMPGGSGDGGPALSAALTAPAGVAVDAAGNIYISSKHCLKKVNTSGIISTIAGDATGTTWGSSGNGGNATVALLHDPGGIVIDATGNIYFTEFNNHWVRKINTAGIISTFAGTGSPGFSGDGGAAVSASLSYPRNLTIDAAGNIYIADAANNRIRKVNTSGIISTIAGSSQGFSGDGGPATSAQMSDASGVAIDAAGNVYVSDYNNVRVRKIDNSGIINTIAGCGIQGNTGDGGPATSAQMWGPMGLAVDAIGNVFITDYGYATIRKVNTSGIISTICGTGTGGFSGDGGPAINAQLYLPRAISFDLSGNLYIADYANNRIRKINLSVGINEANPSREINIYPNPTNNSLFISDEENNFQNSEIEITNYLGQTVLKIPYTNTIDVSKLSNGIYTLKIISPSNKSVYAKFVRE